MRKTPTKFFLAHGIILSISFVLLSFSSNGQSESEDLLIMQISELDAYSYGDIARSLKDNDQVSVSEACVPALLVAFQISDANGRTKEENILYIKTLIASSSELTNVTFKEGFSQQDLRETCDQARRGLLSE
ncbi:MAG: hypothetical protein P8O05_06600 [Flavobacteriales bacterium]|nr:hypothetical protein [Flavobacteriales bacterium]